MISGFDLTLFRWLNSWVGTGWDWAIVFRATYLWYLVMAGVAAFVLVAFFAKFRSYRRRNIELFLVALISAVIARYGITELIRFFYDRERPFEALEGVNQLVFHSGGGSFPSGHAALSFAVASVISFYYPKTSILFFLAALSIGFGRIAAGVHWPSDILGGALVGIVTAWFIVFMGRKFHLIET